MKSTNHQLFVQKDREEVINARSWCKHVAFCLNWLISFVFCLSQYIQCIFFISDAIRDTFIYQISNFSPTISTINAGRFGSRFMTLFIYNGGNHPFCLCLNAHILWLFSIQLTRKHPARGIESFENVFPQ